MDAGLHAAVKSSADPVGSMRPIAESANPLYVAGWQSWLKTSVLAPIAGYENVAISNPGLAINYATLSKEAHLAFNAYYIPGLYCFTGSQGNFTATAGGTVGNFGNWSNAPTEVFTFGNALIVYKSGDAFLKYYLSGSTTGAASPTIGSSMSCGASNAAGTLAMFMNASMTLTSGSTYTATTYNSWLQRTPTGYNGAGAVPVVLTWSISASKFIGINSSNVVFSSVDGIAIVSHGVLPGMSTVAQHTDVPSAYSASSPAVSMFVIKGNLVGDITTSFLVRTASGAAITFDKISTILQLDASQSTGVPKISYGNGEWCLHSLPSSGSLAGYIFKSTDDGLTWKKCSIPVNPLYPTAAIQNFKYLNGAWVSVNMQSMGWHGATIATTHVGLVSASNTSNIPNYVRIK